MNNTEQVKMVKIEAIKEYIASALPGCYETAVILGSGWGCLAELLEEEHCIIPYASIPGFPKATTKGHAGNIIAGKAAGKNIVLFQGRFHYYEGYDSELALIPIIAKHIGINTIICTNSSGGIREDLEPGSLVLLTDHINLLPWNPLRGMKNSFIDMSEAYSTRLRRYAQKAAKKLNIEITEGVLAAVMGPSYETPAEVRFLRSIGADVVSMSMAPEVIMSNYLGLEVLGLSCVANKACTGAHSPINHEEVLQNVQKAQKKFIPFIEKIIRYT